ncbi:hypothetical protein TNCV_3077211 [Trichonephila clavipes]|nr:hypothetical protein TNCV_3077211 [Trichonephila clavipes]
MDPNSSHWSLRNFSNISQSDEEAYEEAREHFILCIAFICLTLYAGVIFRECLKSLNFPYTALMFLFGCFLGIVESYFKRFKGITYFAKINSRLMMHLFLPAIIYESAYSLDTHLFLMALMQCFLLAVPGLGNCLS